VDRNVGSVKNSKYIDRIPDNNRIEWRKYERIIICIEDILRRKD
jgi:hypothetical protein